MDDAYDARLGLYIAGEWLGAEGRDTVDVVNPATGAALAALPLANDADLDRALDASRRGFLAWRATSPEARAAILDLLQQQERVMTQTGAYVAVKTPGATGTPFKTHSGDNVATAAYLLAAAACDAGDGVVPSLDECVRVTATPTRADRAVDVLWMESSGARGCEGTARSEARTCWP